MSRTFKSLLLVMVLAFTASAEDQALERLLRSIDTPPTRAQLLEAGGPNTAATLRGLASATREGADLRRAAISALGWFGDEAARSTLRLLTRDREPSVRKAALETLGFLVQAGASSEPSIRAALADEEPMVRRAAARALGRALDPDGRKLLEARVLVESDRETRVTLERLLGR